MLPKQGCGQQVVVVVVVGGLNVGAHCPLELVVGITRPPSPGLLPCPQLSCPQAANFSPQGEVSVGRKQVR